MSGEKPIPGPRAPGEDARAWPGSCSPSGASSSALDSWLVVFDHWSHSALFEFLTELSPSPASARAVNPSHPGLSLPFCHTELTHGDSSCHDPQCVHSKRSAGTPWPPLFAFVEGRGVLGSVPGQEAAVLYSGGCLGRVSLFGLLKILLCLASPCLHWERELALQDCTRILTGLGTEASNQWSSYTDTSLARDLRALPSALSSVLGQELSRGVRLILAKAVSGLWAGEGRKCRPQ